MGATAHIAGAPNEGPTGGGGTVFYTFGSCPQLTRGVEATIQLRWHTPGLFSDFSVKFRLNGSSGTTTCRVRKNTANGNQVVSVTAGSIGLFQDLVNTDTVTTNDLMSYSLAHGGGADVAPCFMGVVFAATGGASITRWTLYSGDIASISTYHHLAGGSSDGNTEDIAETTFPVDGTLQNAAVSSSANTRNGTTTIRLRVNQADGAIAIAIGAGLTGWFEDLVNTQTVTAWDRGAWLESLAGSTGSITLDYCTVDYETDGHTPFSTSDFVIESPGTYYAPISGYGDGLRTTEGHAQAVALTPHSMSGLTVHATAGANMTVRTRINGGNGNQTVLCTVTPGWFQDLVNTDTAAESDLLNYSVVSGSGFQLRHIGMGGGETAAPIPTVETLTATNVLSTSATLRGRIDPNGIAFFGRFAWWICAESPPTVTETDPQSVGAGSTPVVFTFNLTGLTPSTTYCYQALGNDGGSPADDTEGVIRSFTTSGEAEFIDGTVSHPLTWIEMYVDDGDLI